MNPENLISLATRTQPERKRIATLGGAATKGLPKYSQTKCKNCSLPCPLKEQGISQDLKCQIHDAQRKIIESILDPQKFIESLLIDSLELQTRAGTDFNKIRDSAHFKLELKKELYPNIQQIQTVNIQADLSKVLRIMKEDEEGVSDAGRTSTEVVGEEQGR